MNANPRNPPQLHVVVAEDSPTQAELLREALDEAGYHVSIAGNGVEALRIARASEPALVITDVVMPDMDGYQLCRAVKGDPLLHDTPVMIVTSLRAVDDIVMALESGADNFIRKPFETNALLARIDYLLTNRKLRSLSKLEFGIEISLGGQRHLITAAREQILDLLFSSYEEALLANEALLEQQQEVQKLNLQLAARAVALEDANEQLRSFSHTVSHDLRTPLATIGGFCGLLEHKYGGALEPTARRYLGVIGQESRNMMRIVEDVLYLANVDHTQLQPDDVDLSGVAAEVFSSIAGRDTSRQVSFACDAGMRAACDERLIRIALANLLGNAWKFTGKQPQARIEFSMKQCDGEQAFCVRDNGAGFDMRFAERLFRPFERLHDKQDFEGFGVGLATVQRIVTLHGGRIWARSEPGQGAEFCFTVAPAAADRQGSGGAMPGSG